MSNKAAGTKFEKEFAETLAKHWFWVHLFQDNRNGQPCDVVAARNGRTYLFDCKDCQGNFFELSRMEENQYNALRLFEMTGNSRGKFAIRFSQDEIYLVDYWELDAMRKEGAKRIDRATCQLRGWKLQAWLKYWDGIDGWSEKDADHNWK